MRGIHKNHAQASAGQTMIRRMLWLSLSATHLLASGCNAFGPDQIRSTHSLYNSAIIDTGNEQLLNNLVRLRYRDPTAFLDVSSIAATTRLSFTTNTSGNLASTDSAALSLGGSYETYPTISYAPLQGEDFSKRLLSPIPIDAILSLTRSGWSMNRVLTVCVENINDILNAPTASGPTPSKAPKYSKEWHHLTHLLDHVHEASLLKAFSDPKTGSLKVKLDDSAAEEKTVSDLKRALGLTSEERVFEVRDDHRNHENNSISLITRPLMSSLFYLSHTVDIPSKDVEAGLVTVTRQVNGEPFDWQGTPIGKIFNVQVSETRPDQASIATLYRDHWFFIPDKDLESKSTFLLLTQLFRLQAGATKSTGPALTLPVR